MPSRPAVAILVAPHGGMAHYVMHLWQPMARRARLRWQALEGETPMDWLPRHGVEVAHGLDPNDPTSAGRTAEALRADGIEVVNIQVATRVVSRLEFHLRFAAACRRAGLAVVLTLHNVLPHSVSRYDPATLRELYAHAAGFVVGNECEDARLRETFALDGRPSVIAPMGPFTLFDSGRHDRASARRELGLPPAAPVVLFFGTYREEKGLEVLLEAFPMVQAECPEACLVISTSPRHCPAIAPFLATLRGDARSHRGWRVRDEYVDEGSVETLFRAADVVALPYRRVTQSGVRAVAAAFGRAVVFTDAFGDGPTLDGLWGRCVARDDAPAFAQGLLDLLRLEPRARDALGSAGRERALREESWEQNAARVAALCAEVAAC